MSVANKPASSLIGFCEVASLSLAKFTAGAGAFAKDGKDAASEAVGLEESHAAGGGRAAPGGTGASKLCHAAGIVGPTDACTKAEQ